MRSGAASFSSSRTRATWPRSTRSKRRLKPGSSSSATDRPMPGTPRSPRTSKSVTPMRSRPFCRAREESSISGETERVAPARRLPARRGWLPPAAAGGLQKACPWRPPLPPVGGRGRAAGQQQGGKEGGPNGRSHTEVSGRRSEDASSAWGGTGRIDAGLRREARRCRRIIRAGLAGDNAVAARPGNRAGERRRSGR